MGPYLRPTEYLKIEKCVMVWDYPISCAVRRQTVNEYIVNTTIYVIFDESFLNFYQFIPGTLIGSAKYKRYTNGSADNFCYLTTIWW